MITRLNIYTIGGISSFIYAAITFFFYMYLWLRFGSVLKSGQSGQILTMIDQRSIEWPVVWWALTIIPHAFIPIFLSVLKGLWREEPALASMAFMAGIVALVLGILGPLRCVVISGVLAKLFVNGSDMQKATADALYKIEEAYGKGMYCLFGAT